MTKSNKLAIDSESEVFFENTFQETSGSQQDLTIRLHIADVQRIRELASLPNRTPEDEEELNRLILNNI